MSYYIDIYGRFVNFVNDYSDNCSTYPYPQNRTSASTSTVPDYNFNSLTQPVECQYAPPLSSRSTSKTIMIDSHDGYKPFSPTEQKTTKAADQTFEFNKHQSEAESRLDPNLINELGETNLHIAAYNGNVKVVKQLLKDHASINALTYQDKTPIGCAIENYIQYHDECDFEVIKLLVKHGGYDGSLGTDKTKKILQREIFVIQSGILISNKPIIDILIKAGADKKAIQELIAGEKIQNDETPHEEHSLKKKKRNRKKKSLNSGSEAWKNIDLGANQVKETPLHIAAQTGNLEAIRRLLRENADIHAVSYQNKTPMYHAICNYKKNINENVNKNNFNIVRELVIHGGYGVTPQNEKETQFLKNILEREIFVSHDDIWVPQTRVIKALINAGANKKVMRELIDEKIKEYGDKRILEARSWAYYYEACVILANPSETISFQSSFFHHESNLPKSVTQPP